MEEALRMLGAQTTLGLDPWLAGLSNLVSYVSGQWFPAFSALHDHQESGREGLPFSREPSHCFQQITGFKS